MNKIKRILTLMAFMFAIGTNMNVSAETMPNTQTSEKSIDIQIEVPATIKYVYDENADFKIFVKSNDKVITNLIKVKPLKKNKKYFKVSLNHPIEDYEIDKFTNDDIVITIISNKPININKSFNSDYIIKWFNVSMMSKSVNQ